MASACYHLDVPQLHGVEETCMMRNFDAPALLGNMGISVNVKMPKEIKAAAKEFPAFRAEMGHAADVAAELQALMPWLMVGGAVVVAFVTLMNVKRK